MGTPAIESFNNTGTAKAGDLVQYPDAARADCPAVGHKLVRLERCNRCEHYVGLTERFPSDSVPFQKRFMVGCRFPRGQAIVMLAEDGE